jgi:hypothetical protein
MSNQKEGAQSVEMAAADVVSTDPAPALAVASAVSEGGASATAARVLLADEFAGRGGAYRYDPKTRVRTRVTGPQG